MNYKCPKCGNLVEEGVSPCPTCGQVFNWPKKDPEPPAQQPVQQPAVTSEPITEHPTILNQPAAELPNLPQQPVENVEPSAQKTKKGSKAKKGCLGCGLALFIPFFLLIIIALFSGRGSTSNSNNNSNSTTKNTKYTSIRAEIKSDVQTGDKIYKNDFKVYGVYKDGSTTELKVADYEVSEGTYTPGETITVTITENNNNLSTTIKLNCPEEKYFTQYSREELCNYMFEHLNQYSNKTYYMSLKKDSNGIITQASYYLSNGKYLYFLKFDSKDTIEKYNYVRIEANVTNYGSENTYSALRWDMENNKAALVGATGGNAGKFEADDTVQEINGVCYYNSNGDNYYTEAELIQDYVTQVD